MVGEIILFAVAIIIIGFALEHFGQVAIAKSIRRYREKEQKDEKIINKILK